MKPRYFFPGIIILLVCWAAAFAQDRQKDEAAIKALNDRFAAAWNQADGAAMAATYAGDGCLIDPFGNEARGLQAVDSLLTQTITKTLKGSTTRFEIDYIRFLTADMAFVDATQFINGAMSPEGEPLPEIKLHLVLNVAKKNSQWWFVDARPYWFGQAPARASSGGVTSAPPSQDVINTVK